MDHLYNERGIYMDIRNCKKCGKLYKYDGYKICLKCRQEEDAIFKRVREYVYDNPGATIQLISEETEVTVKKILNYLREGRLEIKNNDGNLLLACEKCGLPITTGRFCEKCKIEMSKELKGSIKKSKSEKQSKTVTDKKGNKMYVANRLKD